MEDVGALTTETLESSTWKKFIQNIKVFFAKENIVRFKKWLPKPHFWTHKNAISMLPYMGIQWYKWQGETSKGCIKAQINYGWILWSASIVWTHDA